MWRGEMYQDDLKHRISVEHELAQCVETSHQLVLHNFLQSPRIVSEVPTPVTHLFAFKEKKKVRKHTDDLLDKPSRRWDPVRVATQCLFLFYGINNSLQTRQDTQEGRRGSGDICLSVKQCIV